MLENLRISPERLERGSPSLDQAAYDRKKSKSYRQEV
jgi:hypothetical protein